MKDEPKHAVFLKNIANDALPYWNLLELKSAFLDHYAGQGWHAGQVASFFMEKSIGKAIALDTLDEDPLTSSIVDDVFFVLKTTLMRGVDTGDAECLCGLVNSVARILEEEFMTMLLSRLSTAFSGAGAPSGGVNSASSTDSERLAVIGPLVNNIDQSCHFVNISMAFRDLPYNKFSGLCLKFTKCQQFYLNLNTSIYEGESG